MTFLTSAIKQFEYYKLLGTQTIERLDDVQLNTCINDQSNSIAVIVKHLHGNMLSRWTDFMTTDGEKVWRKRDEEFVANTMLTKEMILELWNKGWDVLFHALESINANDLEKIIYIRNQGHTVVEAINRQLAHYPYHVGQMVFIGKMLLHENWHSLSIPKGESDMYNVEKFSQEKTTQHFTEEYLKKDKP